MITKEPTNWEKRDALVRMKMAVASCDDAVLLEQMNAEIDAALTGDDWEPLMLRVYSTGPGLLPSDTIHSCRCDSTHNVDESEINQCVRLIYAPGTPAKWHHCNLEAGHVGKCARVAPEPASFRERGLWSDRHGAKLNFQVSHGDNPVDLTRRHPPRVATMRKTARRLVREVIEAGTTVGIPRPRGFYLRFDYDATEPEVTPFRVYGPRVDDGGEIRHGSRLDHVRDLTPPGLTILADDATGDDVAADR